MRAAHGIAGGALKIAPVCNLNNSKATVLFMILAKTTIVWAAVMRFGIKMQGRFRWLVIIAQVFVIFNICGNKDFFKTVGRAVFQHKNFTIFKNNFSIYSA